MGRVDLLQDPRFNNTIDDRTGYKTNSILGVPICNYEGEVIGVAQIINKTDGSDAFTDHDVQVRGPKFCTHYFMLRMGSFGLLKIHRLWAAAFSRLIQ